MIHCQKENYVWIPQEEAKWELMQQKLNDPTRKQAGAELGQAKLKLGLDFTQNKINQTWNG